MTTDREQMEAELKQLSELVNNPFALDSLKERSETWQRIIFLEDSLNLQNQLFRATN